MAVPGTMRTVRIVAAVAAAMTVAGLCASQAAARDTTPNRLVHVDFEIENWLIVNGNYAGHRYSRLNQIRRGNVRSLRVAMMLNLGGQLACEECRRSTSNLEATPLAEDGFLYVPDGWGAVYKIDVREGRRADFVWKMDPQVDRAWAGDVACCGINNRGVALWRDQVISVALDGRLIATNKDTGEMTWERAVADPAVAETLTVAPLVIGEKGIVGPAGAEYGIRGWLDATDLRTGAGDWRTHTAGGNDRDPGETAKGTWGGGFNSWATGGGSIWQTGTYDPELHLTFWGTGNPAPAFDAAYRPGDNLYTSSLLALDPDDGSIAWHFQFTPNDPFEYDEAAESPLVRAVVDGIERDLVVHAARNGHFYGLERATGRFLYAHAYPDRVTWTDGIDQTTGLPLSYDAAAAVQRYNPGTAPGRGEPGRFCPAVRGGKNWEPGSFDPIRGVVFVTSGEECSRHAVEMAGPPGARAAATQRRRSEWTGRANPGFAAAAQDFTARDSLSAISIATGRVKRKVFVEAKVFGTVSTAGDLVFGANRLGDVLAFDADSLAIVWSFNAGSPIQAPPMTFSAGGRQYLAILAGGKASPAEARTRRGVRYTSPSNFLLLFAL